MKSLWLVVCMGLVIVGCGQAPETSNVAQTRDTAAAEPLVVEPTQPAGATPVAAPSSTAQASGVTLTGRSFSGPAFDPPRFEAGGMQLFQHYGSTTATVELKKPVSKVTTVLKPRPNGDSYPVVFLTARRTSRGPFMSKHILDKETIRSADPIVRDFELEAGTYEITLGYFGSSKDARSQLELWSVKFE